MKKFKRSDMKTMKRKLVLYHLHSQDIYREAAQKQLVVVLLQWHDMVPTVQARKRKIITVIKLL